MKVFRSSKCSLKFSTKAKLDKLQFIINEYSKVVNFFINQFWETTPTKMQLLAPIVNLPNTWLSTRLKKIAAREAIDMIASSKNIKSGKSCKIKPIHYGKCINVSGDIASLQIKKTANTYDCWLHIASVGNGIILNLPIKLHKHFHILAGRGKQLKSFIIRPTCVQFCFKIETGKKKENGKVIGVDTGINALATTSDGTQYGRDIKQLISNINRKQFGSKGQQKTRRAFKQRVDEIAKELITSNNLKMVIVEDLKRINHKTKLKRRLSKNMRRTLGAWIYRYWLNRIKMAAENNRVAFRRVNPAYTSQICPMCGHIERGNRNSEIFLCKKCNHSENADVVGGKNIKFRWTTALYGGGYKP